MPKKRFYEEDPTVRKAVESLFLFPDDIQKIIAKSFSLIAKRDCNAEELLKEFRTLGSDRIMALYKSKRKQRHYDRIPAVHDALNYLLVMNPESRIFLAAKVIELVSLMQDYFKLCKQYTEPPNLELIENLSTVYIERGRKAVIAFMQQVETQLQNALKQESRTLAHTTQEHLMLE